MALWLHGRSPATQRAYQADLAAFRAVIPAPLRQLTLGDLQAYQDTLQKLAPTTQARRLSAIKSLLSFGQRTGFLPSMSAPRSACQRPSRRYRNESSTWTRCCTCSRSSGTPATRRCCDCSISAACASAKCAPCAAAISPPRRRRPGHPVRQGRQNPGRAAQVVDLAGAGRAAGRGPGGAGVPLAAGRRARSLAGAPHRQASRPARRPAETVSAHWLRHAHVSHALDRGAPVHLVQATVGHASLTTTSRYAHARPKDSSSLYLPG